MAGHRPVTIAYNLIVGLLESHWQVVVEFTVLASVRLFTSIRPRNLAQDLSLGADMPLNVKSVAEYSHNVAATRAPVLCLARPRWLHDFCRSTPDRITQLYHDI